MSTFSRYKLKANPFEIFSHKHKMANRTDEWEKITNLLSAAFDGRGPKYFVLLGDYGVGKTYMLERLYAWVSEERTQTDVFAVYGKKDVLYEQRLAVMESEPKWPKFGLDFIMRIFDNIERERIVQVLNKADLSGFKSPFKRLFRALQQDDELGFRYLAGQTLLAGDIRKLGFDSPIHDSQTGISLFFDFLRVVKIAKYSSFLLLIDEFEYISTLGERKITQVLNTFREIYDKFGAYDAKHDGMIANPIFVFATSPGGWNTLKDLDQAARKKTGGGGIAPFMERVSPRDMVTLGPFSSENTIELLIKRLSEVREGTVKDDLYPFDRDAIDYIHRSSFNKPRNVIQYCGILLEDAVKDDLVKIDASAAEEILKKYGISPPEPKAVEKK